MTVRPALFVSLLLIARGCGGSDLYDVSGSVTLDGRALEEGQVIFRPEDPRHAARAAKVGGGRYALRLPAGRYRVEFEATRVVPYPAGKQGPMGETGSYENLIPDRYNARSGLTAQVEAGGRNQLDFSLDTEKK